MTLGLLAQVRADIASRAPALRHASLFVSVDPNRDTPERIAAYLNGFDPEFAGVTAPDAELEPLLKALGVAVEKHEHGGANYNVVHNSAIYVLDPNAEWIAVSTAPHDPKVVASDYLRIRQRHSGGRAARRMTSSAWVWLTQHLLPKNLSSAVVYRATRSRRPWLKRPLTRWFAKHLRRRSHRSRKRGSRELRDVQRVLYARAQGRRQTDRERTRTRSSPRPTAS